MNKAVWLTLTFIVFQAFLIKSEAQPCYWVGFTDKHQSVYSLSRPYEFLSKKSVQRRQKQAIPLDETDLPPNRSYIDSIVKTGGRIIHSSRWLNGITVMLQNDSIAQKIRKFSFVREVQLTKPAETLKRATSKFEKSTSLVKLDPSAYGQAIHQVGQLNGLFLHEKKFRGEGIGIAVLDAGFSKADVLPAFDSLWVSGRILGAKDFVSPLSDIFDTHPHGMEVLSVMGANMPGEMIGTAPDASYWLLRSEDTGSEYLIEEDNWVAAAEFADSVGADIINSSLGYSTFNLPSMDHTYAEMDGRTTRVARAANMASAKGMLVFIAAGNEAKKPWRYIMTPADADSAIAVGAVNKDSIRADFSSHGPSADGDIKPNLSATGWGTAIQDASGKIVMGNGTSFSSPVLAGIAACLWQAFPDASAVKIKQALYQSAHLSQKPDTLLGYGIPNMKIASDLLSKYSNLTEVPYYSWKVFPNPFHSSLNIFSIDNSIKKSVMEILNLSGSVLYRKSFTGNSVILHNELDPLIPGVYLLRISSAGGREVHKIIKGT
jgi:hypothetical protein